MLLKKFLPEMNPFFSREADLATEDVMELWLVAEMILTSEFFKPMGRVERASRDDAVPVLLPDAFQDEHGQGVVEGCVHAEARTDPGSHEVKESPCSRA